MTAQSIDRPRGLETSYYTDPGIHALEMERVFAHTRQLVGHRSQVAEPGSLLTATMVPADSATVTSITCPNHTWTYDLGGRLIHARGETVGDMFVPLARADSLPGFLFVYLDPEAMSLEETIPGIEAELLAIAPDAPDRIAPRGNTIHHTAEGPAPEHSRYTRDVEANEYGSFFTWPVSSIQCFPGRVLNAFRWAPMGVDRTLLVREWRFDRTEPTAEQREVMELDWATTVAEDFALMESVQAGMRSRGFSPGPLILDPTGVSDVHNENAVPHLHSLLRAALGDAD